MDWLLAGGIVLGIAVCMAAMPWAAYTALDHVRAAVVRRWRRRRR